MPDATTIYRVDTFVVPAAAREEQAASGFNPKETLARLNVEADMATYGSIGA